MSWYIGSHEQTESADVNARAEVSRASCAVSIGAVINTAFCDPVVPPENCRNTPSPGLRNSAAARTSWACLSSSSGDVKTSSQVPTTLSMPQHTVRYGTPGSRLAASDGNV